MTILASPLLSPIDSIATTVGIVGFALVGLRLLLVTAKRLMSFDLEIRAHRAEMGARIAEFEARKAGQQLVALERARLRTDPTATERDLARLDTMEELLRDDADPPPAHNRTRSGDR